MRQILNNPWVVLGLCSVAVVILYFSADDISVIPTGNPRPLAIGSLPSTESDSPTMESSQGNLAQLTWHETFARDPFAPTSSPGGNTQRSGNQEGQETSNPRPSTDQVVSLPPSLQLSAVTMSPEPKRAMINRKLVAEGDRIEGLRVSRIESDGVWLNGPSGTHHLVFGEKQDKSQTIKKRDKVSTSSPEKANEGRNSRKDTSLMDGRDCSRNSTCS